MSELEITQPEENLESTDAGEATERVEEQALDDATHEPGARVEETQTFEQAEAVESALGEATSNAEQVGVSPIPLPLPKPADGDAPAGELPSPCPDPEDLPEGSGKVETTYSPKPGVPDEGGWLGTGDDEGMVVEFEGDLGEPGLDGVVEMPEGLEFDLAGEDNTIDRDDHPMVEDPELTPVSEEDDDDDGEEATPINLPGPVAADEALSPLPIPNPEPASEESGSRGGGADELGVNMEPIPSPESQGRGEGGEIAVDMEPVPSPEERGGVLPIPIPEPAMDEKGPGGGSGQVAATPINLPYTPDADIALDHPGTGGNVAMPHDPNEPPPPPDLQGQTELSPDDVKMGENLQPAPDYDEMVPSERSVVEIIGKAISDEEYRATLFSDARAAIAGYDVTDEDQTALGEMTADSFDFFAAEVEARFNQAMSAALESASVEAQQQVLGQVVHAVWRDLNPGGLAYILAHKIPQKHL